MSALQHNSRLFQLPPEMRIRIYEAAVTRHCPIFISSGQSESSTRTLLSVCRQIYREAVGIYYGSNAFISVSSDSFIRPQLTAWLKKLGPKKRAFLRDLRISLSPSYSLQRGQKRTEDMERLSLLRTCYDCLRTKNLYVPLSVLRVRIGVDYLNHDELSAVLNGGMEACEKEQEVSPSASEDDDDDSLPSHPSIGEDNG